MWYEELTHWKRPWYGERLRAGGGDDRGEDEIVGWHHWLKGHESEQTLGDSEGQGNLVCCSPWSCRVGRDLTTEQWTTTCNCKWYWLTNFKVWLLHTKLYRNTIDFCILFLYLATLLNSLIISSSVLCEFKQIFYTGGHVLSKERQFYFFPPSLNTFHHFFLPYLTG